MEVFIRQQFYFSPNHCLGAVVSSQIEEPQKKVMHLYRSTRRTVTHKSIDEKLVFPVVARVRLFMVEYHIYGSRIYDMIVCGMWYGSKNRVIPAKLRDKSTGRH